VRVPLLSITFLVCAASGQLASQSPVTPDSLASLEARVFSPAECKRLDLTKMLHRHLRARTLKILQEERRDWDQVKTLADWERFRNPRIKALAASLGDFPERVPLEVRVTKEFLAEGYRRQDLVYLSRPSFWVPANLYLPLKPREKMPGIVIVHSHHRPRTQAELQDMGILWARLGCAVLIMDQIGSGERLQTYPWNREAYRSRYVMGMQLYLAGESLIKWMVWDVMRGVDLLLERPDINRDQIILLGAVAGGGDPAVVTAALDPRIAAVAPFTLSESMPESPRFLPDKNLWPLEFADPGWGEWESTRCLRRSIVDQFFHWTICTSVAPRRLVYSFEMGWNVEDQPAWARFKKVFRLYDALDHLDEAHGFGPFPGPGECANIGPAQRKTLYPELKRWFGIPIPLSEPDDRRPEAELSALNPVVAGQLNMRTVHDMAHEVGEKKIEAARSEIQKLGLQARRKWMETRWRSKLGDIEPNPSPQATVHWKKPIAGGEAEAISIEVEPGIIVPLLLLRPVKTQARLPVVVAVSESGKDRLLQTHAGEVQELLQRGVAVCLPDVRGTGETAPDTRRGPNSQEIALAATELMLGDTLLGKRLKDLRTVLAYLGTRPDLDSQRVALWGDSSVPANPPRLLLDELPGWQAGPEIQRQAEPLGALLALLAGLYEDRVRAVAVRGGLASYLSVLEDSFAYVPLDVIIPGILESGDIADMAATLAPRPILMEAMVDGRNRLVPEATLRTQLPGTFLVRSKETDPSLVRWLAGHL
jgi:cephalosporin-C deacetylase-like acetyl esterase